jgi:hypothetical protein
VLSFFADSAKHFLLCRAGGQYQLKCNETELRKPGSECAQLDTNKDGAINMADDPYTPYYPGKASFLRSNILNIV